jgi:hypothetical protein
MSERCALCDVLAVVVPHLKGTLPRGLQRKTLDLLLVQAGREVENGVMPLCILVRVRASPPRTKVHAGAHAHAHAHTSRNVRVSLFPPVF